jgi:hypothetical protein
MTDEITFDLYEAQLHLLDCWLQYLPKPISANGKAHPPSTYISLKKLVFGILNLSMSNLESRNCSQQLLFTVLPLCFYASIKEPGILLCVEGACVRQGINSFREIFLL